MHALTSILCSKVIEQFNCGAGYLRCCVSSDFTFGTVVETSAPLPEEAATDGGDYDVFLLTTVPNGASTTKQQPQISSPVQTLPQPNATHQSLETQTIVTSATKKAIPCPGICVENIFVRYCSATIPEGLCEPGSTCCVSNHDDGERPPPPLPVIVTTTATTTTAASTIPSAAISAEKIVDSKPQSNQLSGGLPVATTLPGPPCPGSCVAPLFSLLCDAVDDNYYCANDGRCCVNNDDIPTEPAMTTSLPSTIPCPGACIPAFLGGMCNRPSEIIHLTECDIDFVCCYQPEVKDHLHIETQQIPLLRPVPSQSGYNTIPIPQNTQPVHQPPNAHTYPQRPQVPIISNPIIVPHIHNQGGASQIYPGSNPPIYPAPPIHASKPPMPPLPPPPHEGPSIIKFPYPPNNYGSNLYQQQNFVPVMQKQNSSHDTQSIRLSVLAPSNQPESAHIEEYFPIRKPNISQPLPQISQAGPQVIYPHRDKDNDPVRFISPPSSAGEISPVLSGDLRKQQNVHDRFVETAIGFAPDTLKPITVNIPQKPPPTLEKFHPPSTRPSFKPPIKNTSTILVLHVKEPQDRLGVVQDLDFKPDVSQTTFVPVRDSFKPLITHITFKPTVNPTPITLKPITQVSNSKPTAPTEQPKLMQPVEDTVAKPSNANFYTISAEQAKKMRPACPGSCIASFLRFTCFGNNAIYDGFACEGSGIMCCTSVDYIEKYEEHLKSGNPLTFIKPDFDTSTGIQGEQFYNYL